MNQPAETLQFSQEEQGRLLARVYAFILSDQFIGNSHEEPHTQRRGKEHNINPDIKSAKKSKTQTQGETQVLDAQPLSALEPMP